MHMYIIEVNSDNLQIIHIFFWGGFSGSDINNQIIHTVGAGRATAILINKIQ